MAKMISIIILILVTLIVSIISGSALDLSTDYVSIEYEKTDYDIAPYSDLGEGGEFGLVLHLLDNSLTAINFSYEVSDTISVDSTDNINHTTDMSMNYVNGSIEPGNSVHINHSVARPICDAIPAFYFEFVPIENSTAELSIDVVIYVNGDDNCVPQIGPYISSTKASILIFVIIIVGLPSVLYWIYRKCRRI